MDGAGAGDPALAAERRAHQQHAVMGLAARARRRRGRRGAALSSLDAQQGRAERGVAVRRAGARRGIASSAYRSSCRGVIRPLPGAPGDAHNGAMTRRTPRPRAYAPDPAAPGRRCDMPECAAMGEYRAPRSRANLRDYHWFCLAHVREYNATWDYYRGMTPGEIEAQCAPTPPGSGRPGRWRPRLGAVRTGSTRQRSPTGSTCWAAAARSHRRERQATLAPAELREPLAELGLRWPVTLDAVKARYKELAKRHHPDANGGDRACRGAAEDDQSRLCRAARAARRRDRLRRRRLTSEASFGPGLRLGPR